MAALAVMLGVSAVAHGGDIKTYRLSVNVTDPELVAASAAAQTAQHGGGEGNGPSGISAPSVSVDGAFVAFDSLATNLEQPGALDGTPVLADTNGVADIFVHEVRTRLNRRITLSITGEEANGPSRNPAISGDGRKVTFESDATNLVSNDTNGVTDVFVANLATGRIMLLSHSLTFELGDGPSRRPAINWAGDTIAFESDATNFGSDTNGMTDVYLATFFGEGPPIIERLSVGIDGEANGPSGAPSMSESGGAIAFTSSASNLVPGDVNGAQDVFVRYGDRHGGEISLVSVGKDGPANGESRAASVDGVRGSDGVVVVAFESDASNIVGDDANGTTDVFVRAIPSGQTTLVSRGLNGAAQGTSRAPSVSWTGLVAFVSNAPDLVRGPPGVVQTHAFVADVARGTIELVSGDDRSSANGPSYAPAISGDGVFIAYASDASNLVMDDTNGVRDLFARIDETRCANGATEGGPASSAIHGAEDDLGPAESPAHSAACLIAEAGL